jgi:hypothetical protein
MMPQFLIIIVLLGWRTIISSGGFQSGHSAIFVTRSAPDPTGPLLHSSIMLLLEGSAMPDSRHKLRNAGQVFATNRETRIFAAKYA